MISTKTGFVLESEAVGQLPWSGQTLQARLGYTVCWRVDTRSMVVPLSAGGSLTT